ncbi:MAG: hypothetical protein P1U74_01150 [Legionellaceae bacterium]|nr:hypothetical protein [Legionellaceae bacterium]
MLSTIAFVVIFAAVTVLFSEELQSFGMKLLKNKSLRLLVPLLFISWIVAYFEFTVTELLVSCRIFLFSLVYYLSNAIPGLDWNLILEKVIILIVISISPLLIAKLADTKLNLKVKVSNITFWVTMFIWSFTAIIFVFGV